MILLPHFIATTLFQELLGDTDSDLRTADFLDMCEAAGIVAVVTTTAQSAAAHGSHTPNTSQPLPACCAPEDMADLVEYSWGNSSTTWGRKRIADGHPAPYNLRYVELGK